MRPETQWHGLERLTYYVLFPLFLIQTLVKADLTKRAGRRRRRRAAAVGARDVAVVPCAAPPARPLASTAPPLPRSSRARRAGRPMSRSPSPATCSAISGWRWPRSRWSPSSRLSTCSASSVLAHYASPEKRSAGSIVMTVADESPDLGLRDRACAQRHASSAAQALARGGGRARPFLARHRPAGDRRRPASRRHVPAEPRRHVAVFLKLVLMPVIARRAGGAVRHLRFQPRRS